MYNYQPKRITTQLQQSSLYAGCSARIFTMDRPRGALHVVQSLGMVVGLQQLILFAWIVVKDDCKLALPEGNSAILP